MNIERRTYRMLDFLRIPFAASPGMAALRVLDKAVYALIPSLQVLATAAFVDAAIRIVEGQATGGQILPPLIAMLLILSHQRIAFALMGLVRARMDMKLTASFRTAVLDKRARLAYRHVENDETWDLLERVGKDPAARIDGGFDILLRAADMVVRVGSLLLVLMAQAWWAGLAILGFSVPLFWLAVRSGRIHYAASKEAAAHTRRAQYLQAVLTGREGVEERSLFGYTSDLNRRYAERYAAAFRINMKAQRDRFVKMKAASLITVAISALIAAVLVTPLGTGAISIGMFMGLVTATFGLAQMMSWELTSIASQLAEHREYLRDLTALGMLDETPGATDRPAARPNPVGRIEFRDVRFAYPGTDAPILRGLDLTLHARRHYALVGANGAGKTTITKLLAGLYDEYEGDILIDGRDLRDHTPAERKAMLSVVYQDFARYQIRMADSIGLGDVHGACDDDIREAVSMLGMDAAVEALPRGLDTPLGRIHAGGVDLSGGEWQRVAIARSLVSRAPVHILDEPTAALDPVAESDLYELFDRVSAGKTTIFITHRLGAARLADEILVIDAGRVAERGTHEALMALGGRYAAMFDAQKGWYA